MTDFYKEETIAGCDIACEYKDGTECNEEVDDEIFTNIGKVSPYEIKVPNTIEKGYDKTLCLVCTSNNA